MSGRHHSLTIILAPGFNAGTSALRIRKQSSSDQLCNTNRKKYTSASLTGCSLKKSWAMNLIRASISVGGTRCLAIGLGKSCTTATSRGNLVVSAIIASPVEPPRSTTTASPRSAQSGSSTMWSSLYPGPVLKADIPLANFVARSGCWPK